LSVTRGPQGAPVHAVPLGGATRRRSRSDQRPPRRKG
jgi:hypothetical protein